MKTTITPVVLKLPVETLSSSPIILWGSRHFCRRQQFSMGRDTFVVANNSLGGSSLQKGDLHSQLFSGSSF